MRFLCLIVSFLSCLSGLFAQGILLSEDFESTNGTAPPPGWTWIGSGPTYVLGSNSDHGVSVEPEDLSVPPPPTAPTSLLFHPLTYNSGWYYRITGELCVNVPVAGTGAAGALLGWVDPGTGQILTTGPNITSFSQWPFYEWLGSPIHSVATNTLGPNAQFGVILVCSGNTPGTVVFGAFDNITVTATVPWVLVQPKVWLDGPFDPALNLMRDDLRVAGLIPLTEPYSALWDGPGGETVAPSVLATSGPSAIVDWVRVELRTTPTGPTTLIRNALLRRDGTVVDVDGGTPVLFYTTPATYYIVVRHRNHHGVMTAFPFYLPFGSGSSNTFDLRYGTLACYELPAPNTGPPRRSIGTRRTLWSGDATGDGVVKYTGAANDRDAILQAIGGVLPTNTLSNVYDLRDVNMNGNVSYSGANNDRDVVLQTIGGSVLTNTRTEQVP